jgi:hypothetical protein
MDLNAAAEGPHTHESVLETSNAYVNKATRLERQILPLLPGSRESAIADATTHRSELVRFLLENGYRNVRSVDFPKNGSDRASGDARRYRPADLDSAGDLDAFVVLDVDDQASGEHLRDMIGAAYSALRTDGRIILHCNALGNNGRLTEMSRRLIELLKNAGFSDTGVHAPAGPVTTLEGMRRMASLLLSRGNAESNEAWHQDLVTWATKGQS